MKSEEIFSRQVFRARVFRRDPQDLLPGGLTVVYGGCEHCAADYRIDRRGFPFWCLEFVVAGRGELLVAGDAPRTLEVGTIFAYGPGIVYEMKSDQERPLVKYFVDFVGRRSLPLLKEAGLSSGTVAQVFPPSVVSEAFDSLIEAGLDTAPRASRRSALLLEALLLCCADQGVLDGTAESRAFATYRRCRDVIDAFDPSGLEIRSIAATAEACHVDSAYLCRLFRRFARATPYQYLMRRRMTAAAAKLSRPACLVKEVAEELGFADPYHFSRAFKRFHGVSPIGFLGGRRDT